MPDWHEIDTAVSERRHSRRMAAAHPVVLSDKQGGRVFRGRAANTSESGIFVITDGRCTLTECPEIVAEISLPTASQSKSRHTNFRTVSYICRIVRTQRIGQLLGLGLSFVRKLS